MSQNPNPLTKSEDDENRRIAKKSVYGIVWNYASFGLGKILVFITTAILARLLTPEDFGIVAFATLAVSYLSILKDFGLGAALIQHRENVDEAADTVFTLNLLFGFALTVTAYFIAPLIADFFREPMIVPVLQWLGLTFAFNAFGTIHVVRLQRELEFHKKLVPDLGRAIVKGSVSITMALYGFDVWALVFGQLAGVVAGVLLAWVMYPWRPNLRINTRLARGLSAYGISVVGIDAMTIATDNLDYLIIGRAFGSVELGIYTLAFRLPELLVLNPLWLTASAVFPAFAMVQNKPEILRRGFLTAVRFVEIICVPLSFGLALVADPFVRLAFGEQWLAAIPIVRLLSIFVLIRSIGFNAGDVYKAVGRPDVLVKLEILNVSVLVPTLLFGAQFGLVWVAAGHVAASLVRMLADLLVASRFVEVSLSEIVAQLKPSFLSGAVMVACVAPMLVATQDMAPLIRLSGAIVIGGISYVGALWFVERETLLRMGRLVGVPGLR